MTVVIVKPGYAPYEAEINGLHEMQEVVGGTIQAIYPFADRSAVVCNDEGILLGMPFNRSINGHLARGYTLAPSDKAEPSKQTVDELLACLDDADTAASPAEKAKPHTAEKKKPERKKSAPVR